MSQATASLIMIKSVIADMSDSERSQVLAARNQIKEISERDDFSAVGFALAAAEAAVKAEQE